MPKTFVAKNVANISNIAFSIDDAGKVTAINVACDVNFGRWDYPKWLMFGLALPQRKRWAPRAFMIG